MDREFEKYGEEGQSDLIILLFFLRIYLFNPGVGLVFRVAFSGGKEWEGRFGVGARVIFS